MRIAIQTLGTRGDVQPYVALARGLLRRGHEVQLAAPVQFESMVTRHGIDFWPLPGEFLALLDTPEGKAAIAGSRGFGAGLKLLKHVRPLMRRLLDAEWAAIGRFGPDVIIHHPKSIASPDIAARLGRPAVLASPLPGFTPTAAFPSPLLPFANLGPLNRLSHLLATRGPGLLFRKELARWRAQSLGVPSGHRPGAPTVTLYAYSPAVVPRPTDWGGDVLVTGYWFLDEDDWRLPTDLRAFLAAGDKPIYVGFGSMPGLAPGKLAADVIEALARTGKRGVLALGGGALEVPSPPAHVHVMTAAPHDRLLPQMSAALHHGGAGTTAASLRAGLPTIICPFFGDQPFWSRRVADLGAGPAPLDRESLTVAALAAAFTATDAPGMRQTATAMGQAIGAEHGLDMAMKAIEALVPRA